MPSPGVPMPTLTPLCLPTLTQTQHKGGKAKKKHDGEHEGKRKDEHKDKHKAEPKVCALRRCLPAFPPPGVAMNILPMFAHAYAEGKVERSQDQ